MGTVARSALFVAFLALSAGVKLQKGRQQPLGSSAGSLGGAGTSQSLASQDTWSPIAGRDIETLGGSATSLPIVQASSLAAPARRRRDAMSDFRPSLSVCTKCDSIAQIDSVGAIEWTARPTPKNGGAGANPGVGIVTNCDTKERRIRKVSWGNQWFPSPYFPVPVAWVGQLLICTACTLCKVLHQKTSLLQILKPSSPVLANYSHLLKDEPLLPQFSALERYARAGGERRVALVATSLEAHIAHGESAPDPDSQRFDPTNPLESVSPEKLALLQSSFSRQGQTPDGSDDEYRTAQDDDQGADTGSNGDGLDASVDNEDGSFSTANYELSSTGVTDIRTTTRECKRAAGYLQKYSSIGVFVNLEWMSLEDLWNHTWTLKQWYPWILGGIIPHISDSRPHQLCQRSLHWEQVVEDHRAKLRVTYPDYKFCVDRDFDECKLWPASKPTTECKWLNLPGSAGKCIVANKEDTLSCDERYNEDTCEWDLGSTDDCHFCQWMDSGRGDVGVCVSVKIHQEHDLDLFANTVVGTDELVCDEDEEETPDDNDGRTGRTGFSGAADGTEPDAAPVYLSKVDPDGSDVSPSQEVAEASASQEVASASATASASQEVASASATDQEQFHGHENHVDYSHYKACSKCEDKINNANTVLLEWIFRDPDHGFNFNKAAGHSFPRILWTYSCEPTELTDTDFNDNFDQWSPLGYVEEMVHCVRCSICSLSESFVGLLSYGHRAMTAAKEATSKGKPLEADDAIEPMLLELKAAGFGKRSMTKEFRGMWRNIKRHPVAVEKMTEAIQKYFKSPVTATVPAEKKQVVEAAMKTPECQEAAKHRGWARTLGIYVNIEWPDFLNYLFTSPSNLTKLKAWLPEIYLMGVPSFKRTIMAEKCLASLKGQTAV